MQKDSSPSTSFIVVNFFKKYFFRFLIAMLSSGQRIVVEKVAKVESRFYSFNFQVESFEEFVHVLCLCIIENSKTKLQHKSMWVSSNRSFASKRYFIHHILCSLFCVHSLIFKCLFVHVEILFFSLSSDSSTSICVLNSAKSFQF